MVKKSNCTVPKSNVGILGVMIEITNVADGLPLLSKHYKSYTYTHISDSVSTYDVLPYYIVYIIP